MMITRRSALLAALAASVLPAAGALSGAASAAEPTIRIATLKFGTVSWEIDVIKTHGLDKKHGFDLEMIPISGKQAADVMLLGGEADVIVTDWIWVSRQRSQGKLVSFVPYSATVGSVMAKKDGPVKSLADLKGKKIGVSGGPTDKSWIILQAYAKKTAGIDLAKDVEPVFAAPPLLNEAAEKDEIAAIINYWHFLAKLQAKGFVPLVTVRDAAQALGLDPNLPLLGYVFTDAFAKANPGAIDGLAKASAEAKELLKGDAEWERLKPMMKVSNDAEFEALKAGFRAGIPSGEAVDPASAAKMFAFLAEIGGAELTGETKTLDPGTFYKLPS
ncbi:MAG: ABC transporter substrate-binding protein [Hyphomicrobiales bacterium]